MTYKAIKCPGLDSNQAWVSIIYRRRVSILCLKQKELKSVLTLSFLTLYLSAQIYV